MIDAASAAQCAFNARRAGPTRLPRARNHARNSRGFGASVALEGCAANLTVRELFPAIAWNTAKRRAIRGEFDVTGAGMTCFAGPTPHRPATVYCLAARAASSFSRSAGSLR